MQHFLSSPVLICAVVHFVRGVGTALTFTHMHTHIFNLLVDIIATIGTSDRPCWLAEFFEACQIPGLGGA